MIGRDAFVATMRFGLGARAGELAQAAADPRGWLLAQFDAPPPAPDVVTPKPSAAVVRQFLEARQQSDAVVQQLFRTEYRRIYTTEVALRTRAMVASPAPFRERLVAFWSNHFTVSAARPIVAGVAGAFEREAIRPHVAGRFADMLLAVVRHPAMLLYLDNAVSIGPNSPGGRASGKGLNENLAREILELHTVGVEAGYGQADVVALAKLITGWSIGQIGRQPEPGAFHFHAIAHEPGSKTLLGATYEQGGEAEGEAALRALARHPATARHVARKLARHFVADDPPPAVVERFARTFLDSDGDLAALARAAVAAPEAWSVPLGKFKAPQDLVVSALRAIDHVPEAPSLLAMYNELGQLPLVAPSPAGWPDTAADWAGPEAVLTRAEWAFAAGQRISDRGAPEALLDATIGPVASTATVAAVRRAADVPQGYALLFASPEFQRR